MPTGTKKVRSSRTQPKKQTEGPSPAKGGRASPRGSGAGGTFGSPALAAPAPGSPAKASAARRRRTHAKKLTDLLPTGCPADTPTRSEGADNPGAKGRSVMRSVALDLGAKKIAYCEVSDGEVVDRAMVSSLSSLESLLGPRAQPARVAIEACREAWFVHATLTAWGNEVLLVDTTRSRKLGIGQHRRKNDRID